MAWFPVLLACFAAALATWALTGAVRRALMHRDILDAPNERSSHAEPKPRGGGLALVPVILISWLGVGLAADPAVPGLAVVLAGATVLAAVCWIDDVRDLAPAPRLLAQLAAVALGLYGLGDAGPVFQGLLPPLLDRLAAGLAWLWFVNLFNFMDGIDGISGAEAGSIGFGLTLTGALAAGAAAVPAPDLALDLAPGLMLPALLAAATLGFLVWNWAPAKIFLGDVGSVPLGYLIGWLLLIWAIQGQWAAALLLPLYYLADATITLARRAGRGAKVWRPHREHFYQRAVQGGASHARVVRGVLCVNVLLIACATWAAGGRPWTALAVGAAVVGGFLLVLRRWARQPG